MSSIFRSVILLVTVLCFKAKGAAETSCSGTLVATKERQTLTSPNYPNPYPGNISCFWWIFTVYFDADIHIEFKFLDLENSSNCKNDNLTIYQSYNDGEKVAEICGNHTTHENIELGIDALVLFKTNHEVQGGGFVMEYYIDEDDDYERHDYDERSRGYSDSWGVVVVVVFTLTLAVLVTTVVTVCYCHHRKKRHEVRKLTFSNIEDNTKPALN